LPGRTIPCIPVSSEILVDDPGVTG
jgi:hypothetical protein